MTRDAQHAAVVFSGGFGLAAYHAGVFEALAQSGEPVHWLAGSSAGAVTAALIAGSEPEQRVNNLRRYWGVEGGAASRSAGPSGHAYAWIGALGSRLLGSRGHFHPRFSPDPFRFHGLYDLAPTRQRLCELVDFGRLNGGDIRVTIATTDLASGDAVLFDSQQEPIGIDHILASCGFIPEFAPVRVGDRSLGDGGLSLNAPFDPVLASDEPLRLYIVDLYARDGPIPNGLETAAERKSDLLFGNQTFQRLRYGIENRRLRLKLAGMSDASDEIYLLSYRPGAEEAGPDKSFDFSAAGLAQRWQAGALDLQEAHAAAISDAGIRVVRRKAEGASVPAVAAE